MKRDQIILLFQSITAAWLVVMIAGCAAFNQSDESIVRVNATRNPAKASRLTYAGIKAFHVGAAEEALKKFSAAIAVDETYGPAHNNLGLLFYEQGNLYDAVLSFEAAMDYMPNDPTVYYNLGLALESAGKTFEAMDLYQQAVEMDPANPVFLGNLVRLRVRMGENDQSLAAQLQDLILIETRPSWRRWADGQLALFFNDSLDRGPSTPDFNTGSNRNSGTSSQPRERKTIDLTPPASRQVDPEELPASQPRILSGPETVPSPGAEAQPTPPDADSVESEVANPTPNLGDYFN